MTTIGIDFGDTISSAAILRKRPSSVACSSELGEGRRRQLLT